MRPCLFGRWFAAIAFLAFVFAPALPAFGAAGDLDPSFGTGGVLTLELADFSNADVVTQLPSGLILLGGAIGETGEGGTRDFLLGRLSTSGDPDISFDADGFVADSIFDPGPEEIARFLVQPDGKILVVGFGLNGVTFKSIVARYNADGTRDTGFATNGTIVPSPGFAIAEDLDGNVLVGGPSSSASEFAVTRYTSAGVLDTGFGSGGTLTGTIPPAGTVDLRTLNVDAEGRIVVGAKADDVVAVARYFADGSPDTDFGTGGFIFNFCDNEDSPSDLAFQSDGKIIVGVSTGNGATDKMCLLRFTADGEVDNTFDGDGKVLSDIPGVTKETVAGIDVMKDDRIVVGGEVDAAPADSAFFAARYEADGTPDATFGGDGFAVFNLRPGATDFGSDVLVLNDGRVVVSGSATREGTPNFDATLIALQGDVTDLAVTQSADRTEATAGDGAPVVFTIHIANNGPLAAYGVTVADDVPSALTVSSATTSAGTCGGGRNLLCDLGLLNPGDEATVTVTTAPSAAGTVTNTASVAGQIGDSTPADNAASVTVTIAAAAGTGGGGGGGGGCELIRP